MEPPLLAPANTDAAAGTEFAPLVSVKHTVQEIPGTPPSVPLAGLVFGHSRVSGYLLLSAPSTVSLLFCAVCVGIDGPLETVTDPSPLGSVRTMVSLSLLSTDQPFGTLRVNPSFDWSPV